MTGITIGLICVGVIANYEPKNQFTNNNQTPFPTFNFKRRLITYKLTLLIITAIEVFDAIIAFFIGFLYIQLVAIDKVIVGVVATAI